MEITICNGYINDFYGHFQWICKRLPEGTHGNGKCLKNGGEWRFDHWIGFVGKI
jgi:hypothetical protein